MLFSETKADLKNFFLIGENFGFRCERVKTEKITIKQGIQFVIQSN
jgi:hypothetical protein